MYRNILIPVSLDADDKIALACKAAQSLADAGAKVTLLHVAEHLPGYVSQYMPDNALADTRAKLQSELDALVTKVPGATGLVVEGHAGRTILEHASEHGVDCIVIASHRPAMQDYLLGSTAAQVVRHAACAVMVVR